MAITLLDQETQIRQTFPVANYDDTVAPSEANHETNPASLEDDLNNLRSQVSNLFDGQAGDWFIDLNTPATLEAGAQRGVNDLNTGLHALEKKRVLRCYWGLNSIAIAAPGDIVDILGIGELPGNLIAAVVATTLGTVVSTGATMGTASLVEVAGTTAISPKNLVEIVNAATRDPILDAGDKIYGLMQGELGLADGDTILDAVSDRVQISFVKLNATGNDLVAITAGAMNGVNYDYCYVERVRLEDLNEADFLGGANIDVPAGTTVTRQAGYDNQGATPVELTTNAILDLAAGIDWSIRDLANAPLFVATEGSTGGTTELAVEAAVDTFRVDAIVNDFDNGASFDTGVAGTTINVGVTANQIDSGGALTVASGGAADLNLVAANEMLLDDVNQAGSTWAQTGGIKLSETTAEWDAFEVEFGEVSLLNAITQANASAAARTKVHSIVTVAAAADTDVSLSDLNLSASLGDLSGGTFVTDYDIYLNGVFQVNGVDAAANLDVYPGTSLALGQLKFEKKLKVGDVICVISWV